MLDLNCINNNIIFTNICTKLLYKNLLNATYIQQLKKNIKWLQIDQHKLISALIFNDIFDYDYKAQQYIKLQLDTTQRKGDIYLNTVTISIIIKDLEELFGTKIVLEFNKLQFDLMTVQTQSLIYVFIDMFTLRFDSYNIDIKKVALGVYYSLVSMDLTALLRIFGEFFEVCHHSDALKMYQSIVDILCFFYKYCTTYLNFVGLHIATAGKYSKQLSVKRKRYKFALGVYGGSIKYGCYYRYRQMWSSSGAIGLHLHIYTTGFIK